MPRYPEVEYIIGRNRVEPRVPTHLCIDTVLIRFLGLLRLRAYSDALKIVLFSGLRGRFLGFYFFLRNTLRDRRLAA